MPDQFKKIDKDFVLSDSSVNVYGFRLLTSGYLMDEFLKNPIGYYGHDSKDGILLKWEDVRLSGDQVLGKPVINMAHPRADRTVSEIENGFLKAASLGKIVLEEYELQDNPDDADDPIVVGTKWWNKETSLVDSPGNRNAFTVQLFDINDKEINLSDINEQFKIAKMAKITLAITPELITLLDLADGAEEAAILKKIKDLKDEHTQLTKDKKDLTAKATAKEVSDLLDKGTTDKKLTAALRTKLEADYATNPKGLKDLLDTMPAHQGVVAAITEAKEKDLAKVADLKDKDWDALDRSGKLKDLKDSDYDSWAQKFEEKFKRKPRKAEA